MAKISRIDPVAPDQKKGMPKLPQQQKPKVENKPSKPSKPSKK
jgi:hypothetical protein